MNLPGSLLILVLTLGAIGFAVVAVETRALVRSTHFYVAHSCCLILIYVTYAVFAANDYLFIWAGLCLVNTCILPFLQGGLMYTAKRIPAEERASPAAAMALTALAVATIAAVGLLSSISLVISTSPIENLDQTVSLNFLVALLLFGYGIIVLIMRRHLFKMVLGLLFMTAGAHLTLVQMAPGLFSMVEIEVLTKVIATVFAMLYAARLLAKGFGSVDADQLLRADA